MRSRLPVTAGSIRPMLADHRHDGIVARVDQREALDLEAVPGIDPLLQGGDDSVPSVIEPSLRVGPGYVVLDLGMEQLEESLDAARVIAGGGKGDERPPDYLQVLLRHRYFRRPTASRAIKGWLPR
jgi:hypothetical protein